MQSTILVALDQTISRPPNETLISRLQYTFGVTGQANWHVLYYVTAVRSLAFNELKFTGSYQSDSVFHFKSRLLRSTLSDTTNHSTRMFFCVTDCAILIVVCVRPLKIYY